MRVLVFSNQKGGVMKTTCSVHVAVAAERAGISAAILELDRQGTASVWSETRNAPPYVTKIDSNALPQALARLKERGTALVVLDCPGSHSPAVASAIKAADLVLLPCRPQGVDIHASAETLATCQRLGRPYAYVLGPVIATEGKAAKARNAFEREGHRVVPVDITQRAVCVTAIETGQTVFEIEPKGKSAAEMNALWSWVKKELAL
jgi:chromosome partitioning protein